MIKAIFFSGSPKTIILHQSRLFILEVMENPIQTGLNNKEGLLTHVTGRIREMEDFSVGLV